MERASHNRAFSKTGFTLIEILVALFIFSVIVTTVFGSYRFVFGKKDIIHDVIRIEEMARICMDRMVRDLQALHVTPEQAYRKPDLDGSRDPFRFVGDLAAAGTETFPRTRFASLAHVPLGLNRKRGIAEIVYYVMREPEQDEAYPYVLRRSDRLNPSEPFVENAADPVLCESLRSLRMTYVDAEGENHDRWDSDDEEYRYATPRAVAIEIELGTGNLHRRYKTKVYLPVQRGGIGD